MVGFKEEPTSLVTHAMHFGKFKKMCKVPIISWMLCQTGVIFSSTGLGQFYES